MNNISCPRCQGFVIADCGETRCILCGWYLNERVCFDDHDEDRAKCYNCTRQPEPGKSLCTRCRTTQNAYKQRRRDQRKAAA